MPQPKEHTKNVWAKIVTHAWKDPKFKEKLIKNPDEILKSEGCDCHGKKAKVVEDSKDTFYLVLPEKPAGNLSEEKLLEIAAGTLPPIHPTAPIIPLNG